MRNFSGKTAAITGAGSGIGKALAEALAARGCHLALSDINGEALAQTVDGIGSRVHTTSTQLDVADRLAVNEWAANSIEAHGSIELVVNNAGVALQSPVSTMTFADFEWLMNINFWGVVNGTKAFLPHLLERNEGHIVNVSSVFGLMAIPSQSAYNAAKFAVRGFTDCLRIELDASETEVSCTTVHPGGIKTNIARSARYSAQLSSATREEQVNEFDRLARSTPEAAARKIIWAVERDRRRTLIGTDAFIFDGLSRIPAGLTQRMLAKGYAKLIARQAQESRITQPQ